MIPSEKAALIAEHLANHDAHGYSQPNREGHGWNETIDLGDGKPVTLHDDYDCSRMAIECYKAQGIDTGGASYTMNMFLLLETGNFECHSVGNRKRGDILNSTRSRHAAIYLGNGKVAEAHHGDYAGGIDGEQGDQDGTEIRITDYYDDDWTACYHCILPDPDSNGWKKENGKWHYYRKGKLLTNGWCQWRSIWYYMDENGDAVKDKWIHDDGWYYFKDDGQMARSEILKHPDGWACAGHDGKIIQKGTLSIENGLIQI